MDFKTMKIKQWFVSSLILYTFKLKYVWKKHLKCKFKSKSWAFLFFSSIIIFFSSSSAHLFFAFCPVDSPFFFDKFAISAFLFIQFHTAGYNIQVWKKWLCLTLPYNFTLENEKFNEKQHWWINGNISEY